MRSDKAIYRGRREGKAGSVAIREEAWRIFFEAATARELLRAIETRLETVVTRGRDNPHFGGHGADDVYRALAGATKALETLRPMTALVDRLEEDVAEPVISPNARALLEKLERL